MPHRSALWAGLWTCLGEAGAPRKRCMRGPQRRGPHPSHPAGLWALRWCPTGLHCILFVLYDTVMWPKCLSDFTNGRIWTWRSCWARVTSVSSSPLPACSMASPDCFSYYQEPRRSELWAAVPSVESSPKAQGHRIPPGAMSPTAAWWAPLEDPAHPAHPHAGFALHRANGTHDRLTPRCRNFTGCCTNTNQRTAKR